MRNLIIIAATIAALAAGGAQAKSCKDAQGHFTKCPAAGSVLPSASTPGAGPTATADVKAKPKKLSKAEARNELAGVQAAPAVAAPTPASAKKGVSVMGMFKPKGAAPGAAATPMAATSPASATALPAGHPVCKKGKPCGNSCIAQNKVCHKG